jgi:hypothetical protein
VTPSVTTTYAFDKNFFYCLGLASGWVYINSGKRVRRSKTRFMGSRETHGTGIHRDELGAYQ